MLQVTWLILTNYLRRVVTRRPEPNLQTLSKSSAGVTTCLSDVTGCYFSTARSRRATRRDVSIGRWRQRRAKTFERFERSQTCRSFSSTRRPGVRQKTTSRTSCAVTKWQTIPARTLRRRQKVFPMWSIRRRRTSARRCCTPPITTVFFQAPDSAKLKPPAKVTMQVYRLTQQKPRRRRRWWRRCLLQKEPPRLPDSSSRRASWVGLKCCRNLWGRLRRKSSSSQTRNLNRRRWEKSSFIFK